jgi:type I restriction-modification system DNA methylase subunit
MLCFGSIAFDKMPIPTRVLPRHKGTVSERTFYPALLEVIRQKGGAGVQEVEYNSVPDIQFEFLGRPWLLSVKIGESLALIKAAFLQYLRHKQESGIEHGLLLLLPESLRTIRPTDQAIRAAISEARVTVLIDALTVKEEVRDRVFAEILDFLRVEITPRIEQGIFTYYSLDLVLGLLREQVTEVMRGLSIREKKLLKIVTSWKLLSGLGRLEPRDAKEAARFLAAYIVLSQIIFLRLFSSVRPEITKDLSPANRQRLRHAFKKVLDINYRPIFELDVLDLVPNEYLRDTFDLIWGMEVEKVRFELPGRIFHELMPSDIRKMLAAFYTRPQAAELLAKLTIPTADAKVFDPASGSGTILTAAYRAKRELHEGNREADNPHRRFCEEEIFGCDIMPFAQHLTCANLAAMDVSETIERTQILLADSLDIVPGKAYRGGVQQYGLFPRARPARKASGEEYDLKLQSGSMDVILMNPPFTKVERGIREYVDMERFRPSAGGEVGLWGHFIFLADIFLRQNGTYGAVLPINVLRGRESTAVRGFMFTRWSPLYVLKCTRNYGFSEWAEYRDILFIAKKTPSSPEDRVKFCLVKKNLTQLTADDIGEICDELREEERARTGLVDIDSYSIQDLMSRFPNMMWFCATSDFQHRDVIVSFCEKFSGKLDRYAATYFREGYRPVPMGVSKFLFLTRAVGSGRTDESFLQFSAERTSCIDATSALGVTYKLEKESLLPSLRTAVGLSRMDITGLHDYIAYQPYEEFSRVKRAAGYRPKAPKVFWEHLRQELEATRTKAVTVRRINPYSPNVHLAGFVSEQPFSPSNQLNVVQENDVEAARAFCTILNSSIFLAQFFLLKEESTGRFVDIRFYDLAEMLLRPKDEHIAPLQHVFAKYAQRDFPSLREQFDTNFDLRYGEFWESQKQGPQQQQLWTVLDKPVVPCPLRLEYDLDVCYALGVAVSPEELQEVYQAIVEEMLITRRLSPD